MTFPLKTIASILATALLAIFTMVFVSPQKLFKQKTKVHKNSTIKPRDEEKEGLFV